MSTFMANKGNIERKWYILDAANKPLGKTAAAAATLLRGKHKPEFTPNADCGDFVIIINAEKVRLTGKKLTDKEYVRHSGYPGGIRLTTPAEYLKKNPEFIIEKAVKGMLPRTRLGAAQMRNLKVYAGGEHPHAAQAPRTINLNEIK